MEATFLCLMVFSLILGLNLVSARTYTVSTKLEKPFIEITNGGVYEGFLVDLMAQLGKKIDVDTTFSFITTDEESYPNADGGWSGIIGDIINGRADIGGLLPVQARQENIVDHSRPILSSGITLVGKRPSANGYNFWIFMMPFSTEAWVLIAAASFAVLLAIYLMRRRYTEEEDVKKPLEVLVLKWTFIIFWILLAFLYSANLSALIQKGVGIKTAYSPIQSADDLERQTEVKYGVVQNGYAFSFFESSRIGLYERIFNNMQTFDMNVKSAEEGIKKVQESDGKYIFIADSSVSAEYYAQQPPCNVYTLDGQLNANGLSLVLPIDSDIKDLVNRAILDLRENGDLQKLSNKWLQEKGQCGHFSVGDNDHLDGPGVLILGVMDIFGTFVILIIGTALSLLVVVAKILRGRFKK